VLWGRHPGARVLQSVSFLLNLSILKGYCTWGQGRDKPARVELNKAPCLAPIARCPPMVPLPLTALVTTLLRGGEPPRSATPSKRRVTLSRRALSLACGKTRGARGSERRVEQVVGWGFRIGNRAACCDVPRGAGIGQAGRRKRPRPRRRRSTSVRCCVCLSSSLRLSPSACAVCGGVGWCRAQCLFGADPTGGWH